MSLEQVGADLHQQHKNYREKMNLINTVLEESNPEWGSQAGG